MSYFLCYLDRGYQKLRSGMVKLNESFKSRFQSTLLLDYLSKTRWRYTVFIKGPPIKATAKITIKDFVEVITTSTEGERYHSEDFMVGNTPMAIKVTPNEAREEYKGYISVALWNKGKVGMTVKCQFSCAAKSSAFEHEIGADEQRGFLKFVNHVLCEDHFKEKDFVLTANVEILGERMKIACKEYKALPEKYCVGLCKNLWERRDTGDFVLIFSGLEVPCHKHVLSAASPVFAAMVENEHREAIENKANIEVSPEVGRAFIRFLYTGELEEGILKEEATVFLELGEKYDVQG